jgi:hypothetical protein
VSCNASFPRILRNTAFVWRRDDGTNALVQTWTTNLNDNFHKTFEISEGTNPDLETFQPQAVSEFQESMVRLFGPAAAECPILFCHKETVNTSPVVAGVSEEVLAHIKEHPELMRELAILSIDSEGLGFVADGTSGNGRRFEKHFALTAGEHCVVYRKAGWDSMGCTKPLHQFLLDAKLHEPATVKRIVGMNENAAASREEDEAAHRATELREEEARWASFEQVLNYQAEELPRALPTEPTATVLNTEPTEPMANVLLSALRPEPVATVVHAVPTEPVANILPMAVGTHKGSFMGQEQHVTGIAPAMATAAEEERLLAAEALVAIAERAAEQAALEVAAKVTLGSERLTEPTAVKELELDEVILE